MRNILLSLASITVFFGLLEFGLRLSGSVPTDAIRSAEVETRNAIPGLYEPGQDFVDRIVPQRPYRIQINSLGFRGGEFPREKQPGRVRVLCLGDSFTFGHLVLAEEAFPARLEQLLRGRARADSDVEVINGGANAFTIPDELSFLRDKALDLRPDVVILEFTQNDVADLARRRPISEVMKDYSELKSVPVVGPALRVLQRSAIFNSMLRSAAWMRVKLSKKNPSQSQGEDLELWRRYRTQLEELAALVREHGARLLFVTWPSDMQVAGKAPATAQEILSRTCEELGIPYLDLTPTMSVLQAGGVDAYLTPIDWHPSPAGHEAAARAIAGRLIELGYLETIH